MNYKQLINNIYSFEWNNEYDYIKHWSDISLGYYSLYKKVQDLLHCSKILLEENYIEDYLYTQEDKCHN